MRQALELVTLAIIAYRQEAVVAEAIAAAFAQTYQPLEILLSDDCSPDGTYQVMEQMAAGYTGPHRLRLNRNRQNLGLIGHVNRVFDLAEGVLIVANAGDDISEPERVARLYAAFRDRRPMLVHSNVTDMALDGTPMPRQRARDRHAQLAQMPLARLAVTKNNCIGASCGWNPDLMRRFGPITEPRAFEDRVMHFRASLVGEVAYVDARLLRYRRGGGLSAGGGKGPADTRKALEVDLATFRQRLKDCLHVAPERQDVLDALGHKIAKRARELAALAE